VLSAVDYCRNSFGELFRTDVYLSNTWSITWKSGYRQQANMPCVSFVDHNWN